MDLQEFKEAFVTGSRNIIKLGIEKGYFNAEKKQELEAKLYRYIQKGFKEEKDGVASYDPNTEELFFNYKKYNSKEEALILVLHELKHALDHYNLGHENEHDGFMKVYSSKGVGQNESCTERFATDIAEEIMNHKIPYIEHEIIGLKLTSNLSDYRIQDNLDRLFCETMGISQNFLMNMQNEENQEGAKKLEAQFNKFANYDKLRDAFDEIYKICYRGTPYVEKVQKAPDDSLAASVYEEISETVGRGIIKKKEIDEFSSEEQKKIERVHKLIQLAQKEMSKYLSKANPERLEKLEANFIETLPEYALTAEEENEYDLRYRVAESKEHINNSDIQDMIALMRNKIETDRSKDEKDIDEDELER